MKKRQGISLPYATQLLSFALGLGAMWAFLQLRVSTIQVCIIITIILLADRFILLKGIEKTSSQVFTVCKLFHLGVVKELGKSV